MENRETNTNAIIGFGLSIATYVLPMYVLFAIAGLVVSIIGLTQANARRQKGKGFAIIGIILSSIGVIIALLDSVAIGMGY